MNLLTVYNFKNMSNCLVTKLKSTVNNEDLSKLNVLTIKTKVSDSPTTTTQLISIGASENGDVSINSPSVGLYQSGISGALVPYPYNIGANTTVSNYFENKDGIIELTGKYNLKVIKVGTGGTVRIKEIYGISNSIISLRLNKIEEGELDATKLVNALNPSGMLDIMLPDTIINSPKCIINKLGKGIIGEFKAITEISQSFSSLFDNIGLDDIANNVSISAIHFLGNFKEGNLSSLAKLTKLSYINFSDSKQNSGDIMDFINPWIQAGRTSGKIMVVWLPGQKNITLNGSPVTYPSGVPANSAYLNWTSDGTVTFTPLSW